MTGRDGIQHFSRLEEDQPDKIKESSIPPVRQNVGPQFQAGRESPPLALHRCGYVQALELVHVTDGDGVQRFPCLEEHQPGPMVALP